MPTRVADRSTATPRRTSPAGPLPLLLAGLLLAGTGCSADTPGPTASPEPTPSGSATASPSPAPVDVSRAVRRLLERRAAALEARDAEAFLAGVVRDPEVQATERAWFDTLALLPVGLADYRLAPETLSRRPGGGYTGVVDLHLRLDGFDPAPTLTRYRMRFRAAGRGFRVAGVRAGAGAQPWDLGPVLVRRDTDVVVVLDALSVGAGDALVPAVRRALADVRAELPVVPPTGVVVHATGDPAYLSSLDDVPGGDPDRIDALAVELPAADGGPSTSTRIVLDPDMVGRDGPGRDRLLRHEITHVATAWMVRDVPLWLSEGLAEYVSVQPMAPRDRAVSRAAIEAAEDGLTALPADEDFNGLRSGANYGISWWACEYVARTWSEAALWNLVRAWSVADPGTDVLRRELGITEAQLARRTARLVEAEYGAPAPAPSPRPTASESPTATASPTPSPSPTPEPSPSRASPTPGESPEADSED